MTKTAAEIEQLIYQARLKCGLEARGLWDVIIGEIQFGKSDRDGHLMRGSQPLTLDDLARIARTSTAAVVPLLRELSLVDLIAERRSNGAYTSPMLMTLGEIKDSDEKARLAKCQRAAESRKRSARCAERAQSVREKPRTPSAPEAHAVSPIPPFLPLQPPLIHPTPSEVSGETIAGSPAAEKPKPKRAGKRVRTDGEHRTRAEFIRWFSQDVWPACFDGVAYDFDSEDPQKRGINHGAAWRFLDDDAIGFDLERAKLAAGYFAEFCAFNRPCWPCPLQKLAKQAGRYLEQAKRPRRSYVLGQIGNVPRPSAVDRGQFASDFSQLRSEFSDEAGPSAGRVVAG